MNKKELKILKEIKKIYPDMFRIPNLVDVIINRECNLRCRHCDWPDKFKSSNKELSESEWIEFVKNFKKTSPREKTIAIAGREPFLTPTSRRKVANIISAAKKQGIYVGVVNNGHFVRDFISEYPDVKMDYFDVSMEGPEKINDAVRGRGSFKRALEGLKIGIKHKIAKKIFISITLTKINLPILKKFIKKANGWGIQNFVFHSLVPGKYVDESLRYKDEDFIKFIPAIEKLSKEIGGDIIIDVYPAAFQNFKKVLDKLSPSITFFLDQNGYLVGRRKNCERLYFRFINVLSSLIHFFVVTPDGLVVTPTGMRTECYAKNKLADIKKIKKWKENPNKKEIMELIKDGTKSAEKKYFPFLLGNKNGYYKKL